MSVANKILSLTIVFTFMVSMTTVFAEEDLQIDFHDDFEDFNDDPIWEETKLFYGDYTSTDTVITQSNNFAKDENNSALLKIAGKNSLDESDSALVSINYDKIYTEVNNSYFVMDFSILQEVGNLSIETNQTVDYFFANITYKDLKATVLFTNNGIYTVLEDGSMEFVELIDNMLGQNAWNDVTIEYDIDFEEFRVIFNGEKSDWIDTITPIEETEKFTIEFGVQMMNWYNVTGSISRDYGVKMYLDNVTLSSGASPREDSSEINYIAIGGGILGGIVLLVWLGSTGKVEMLESIGFIENEFFESYGGMIGAVIIGISVYHYLYPISFLTGLI